MDSARLFALGWRPQVGLEEGLRLAYADFTGKRGVRREAAVVK
jgi:nucleoside-diphosphate-sugar epimerase